MRIGGFVLFVVAVVSCGTLSGCLSSCSLNQNPDQLRQNTANATAAAKRDARAVAQGIREGWSQDKAVDINQADAKQLQTLPGVGAVMAQKIIAGRPYAKTDELVAKHIMSRQEYDRVASRVKVRGK